MSIILEQSVTFTELQDFAKEVLSVLKNHTDRTAVVLALSGDLGAGKTTFVQALGRCLGITETITSPTFTIMKGYETTDATFTHLVHMDAYRIEDEEELKPLRFTDILTTPNTLLCVEWASLIKGALPEGTIHLAFTIKDETTRTATLSAL